MTRISPFLFIVLLEVLLTNKIIFAQEEEPINYYQMEPLDDRVFIHIQNELIMFSVGPPDSRTLKEIREKIICSGALKDKCCILFTKSIHLS